MLIAPLRPVHGWQELARCKLVILFLGSRRVIASRITRPGDRHLVDDQVRWGALGME